MEVCSGYSNIFFIHSSIYSNLNSAFHIPWFLSIFKLYIYFSGSVLFSFFTRIFVVVISSFLNHSCLFDFSLTIYHSCQSFSDYFISPLSLPNSVNHGFFVGYLPRWYILDFSLLARPLFFFIQFIYSIVYLMQILAYFLDSSDLIWPPRWIASNQA